jgi:hypothetical protein
VGLRQAVRRSILTDANEQRNWRIWADLASVLIRRADQMYADEPLGLDVNIAGKVYALDSSTIENLLLPRLLGLTVLVGTQKLDLLARSVLYSLFFFLQLGLELELTQYC